MNKKITKINTKKNNIKMMEDCNGKLKPYYKYIQNNKSIMVEQKTNLDEVKVLKKVFSAIDFSNNNSNFREISLKKTDIIKLLFPFLSKAKEHNISEEYYEKCEDFLRRLLQIEVILEDKEKYLYTVLCSHIAWEKYTDIVKISFSEKVAPYIFNLQKKLTQYEETSVLEGEE